MLSLWLRMNGKKTRRRIGMNETAWQSQGWDEWQEDTTMRMEVTEERPPTSTRSRTRTRARRWKRRSKLCETITYFTRSQQAAAAPSLSNASGFFVTNSSLRLTSVKVKESEEQHKEPGLTFQVVHVLDRSQILLRRIM